MRAPAFQRATAAWLGLAAACLLGCPPDVDLGEPFFPEDYEAVFTEVRECRESVDHDLNKIRILADDAALEPYLGRAEPFPEDAVVLKVQYDFGDLDCEGEIKKWTAIRRLAEGSAPEQLDWSWQAVDLSREVVEKDELRCINCHTDCGVPADGYEGTCAVP